MLNEIMSFFLPENEPEQEFADINEYRRDVVERGTSFLEMIVPLPVSPEIGTVVQSELPSQNRVETPKTDSGLSADIIKLDLVKIFAEADAALGLGQGADIINLDQARLDVGAESAFGGEQDAKAA
jgi:hypothetical protein